MARLSSREILWNKIYRTCFQDRVMPYAYWFDAITDSAHHEHKKVLDQSVSFFSGANLVRLLGERKFTESWRTIRDDVDVGRVAARQGKSILDGLWSMIMTGFAFSNHAFSVERPISNQLKATYIDICKQSNKNIYQVARDMNRPYSRVYADIKHLQAIGLVQASPSVQSGKRVTLLSAA